MKRFDVEGQRQLLCGDTGYEFLLARSLATSEKADGLTTSAHGYLNAGIKCLLVGLDDPGRLLLEKAREWLQRAIAHEERPRRYFEFATEAQRFHDRALTQFLLEDLHDEEALAACVDTWSQYLSSTPVRDTMGMSLMLLDYLDAERYAELITLASQMPELASTIGRGKVDSETGMMRRISEEELAILAGKLISREAWGRRNVFLQRHVNRWLVDGHFDIAAIWVKVLFWKEHRKGLAREVVLKLLNYV